VSDVLVVTAKKDFGRHNYSDGMMEAAKTLDSGQIGMLRIRHDGWCKIFKGDYCNCEPDLYLDGELFMKVRKS